MRTWKTDVLVPRGVVVIVHGLGEHHGRYRWLKDRLIDEGFHVISGDLPGHGRHLGPRGHVDRFDEYIETINQWIVSGQSLDIPVYLLGHSMGGLASIRTVQEKHPDIHGLILSSPCLGIVNQPPRWLLSLARILNKCYPKCRIPTKGSADNDKATRNPDILKRDAHDSLMLTKVSVRWYFELDKAMVQAVERNACFPNIPLLVMQAGSDKIVDKQAVQSWFDALTIESKHYKEWAGLYHEVYNEPERNDVFTYSLGFMNQYMNTH
ncbi:alpha/beta hydrolase [Tuberibacillus sp. Marseille-P3662]|uniref:alpha/beta hydrolase n=1 Tax=Tuberibacillus sp. Marseille-P3662 TaxID=1965358 RepID=UPI000A1CBF1F|nr:alpha/beta hydrolase [Tuberibacillus sp. Marseille-P3662]